jgi:glycosyltransferase involved in cell wall biosynthesis
MRILFVSPQPLYEERGSTIAVYEELKILSGLGYQIDVATYPIGKDVRIPGVRTIRIANPLRFKSVKIGFSLKKFFLDIILLVKVICLMRKKHYDCIHGVEEGAVIALICKNIFKVPVIYDMHSSLPEQLREVRFLAAGPGRWLAIWLENWLVRKADIIFATRGLASRVLSIAPGKFVREYSFYGFNCDQLDKNSKSYFAFPKSPVVAYAGNFTSYQGLELLIDAAEQVHLEMTNVKFLLVGGAESEILHLSKLVKQRKLESIVYLLPCVSRTEAANLLMQAKVLVLPRPRGENTPLKIYDYVKSGKPIVATNIPAHTAVLSEKAAFLVKPTGKALANGLLQVLQNPHHAKRLALESIAAETHVNSSLRRAIIETYSHASNKKLLNHNAPHKEVA